MNSIGFLVITVLNVLLNVHLSKAQHAECELLRTVEPTFNSSNLTASFGNFKKLPEGFDALAWPEDVNQPVTFTLKSSEKTNYNEHARAIIQIAMNDYGPLNTTVGQGNLSSVVEDNLFNCFIDRSERNPCLRGRENPRCCYKPGTSFNNLFSAYPVCNESCRLLGPNVTTPVPCQAVCFNAMVIQVEFYLNRNFTGGKTAIKSVFKKTQLLQKEKNDSQKFIQVQSQEENAVYRESYSIDNGSPLSDELEVGFWLRWIPASRESGPYLEVGRNAEDSPYLVHDFRRNCFDCDEKDQFGWVGSDVQTPLLAKTFQPKFWYANGLSSSDIDVGFNCKNVILSGSQPQRWLDGPCINHVQCRDWCQRRSCLGRSCKLDTANYGSILPWLGVKTCQMDLSGAMPINLMLILLFICLTGLAALILLALCLFYLGSIFPRKKKAKTTSVQTAERLNLLNAIQLEEWEHQTIEQDRGIQAPMPFNLTTIPSTVPYSDDSLERDIRRDSIIAAFSDDRIYEENRPEQETGSVSVVVKNLKA